MALPPARELHDSVGHALLRDMAQLLMRDITQLDLAMLLTALWRGECDAVARRLGPTIGVLHILRRRSLSSCPLAIAGNGGQPMLTVGFRHRGPF
ncbi:hypothetical protein Ais01nite_02440 [Asanoa ishikariensis]|nr:hypothetical protein Ais01nite_02440 [Asanoa ishikariensis]